MGPHGTGRLASRTELMRVVEEQRSGRVFGIANSAELAASVVATVIVATIADRVGVVTAFATLAALAAVPMLLIVVSLFRPHLFRRRGAPVADDLDPPVGRPESELHVTYRRGMA
jgi:MFS-type transporter involved in bile tolerance (Atg22 family)